MIYKAMECLQPKREFAQRHRALVTEAALLQAVEILWPVIVRAVDDAKILAAPAFDCGLEQAFAPARVLSV